MKKIAVLLIALMISTTFTACDKSSEAQKHLESMLSEQLEVKVNYVQVYLLDKDKGYDISVLLEPLTDADEYQAACEVTCAVVQQYFTEKSYALSKLSISVSGGFSSSDLLVWKTSDCETGMLYYNDEIYDGVSVHKLSEHLLPAGQMPTVGISQDSLMVMLVELVQSQLGEDEKVKDVHFEGNALYINIDLCVSDPAPLTYSILAESRTSAITDAILAQKQLDETWNTITLEFVDIGTITFTKADIQENAYGGRYFDVPADCFE